MKQPGYSMKRLIDSEGKKQSHSFFFSSSRRHTRSYGDWSSDVCSSDLAEYSSAEISGTTTVVGLAGLAGFLVRGKLPHRVGDLRRAWHVELLLRSVEGHGRDIRPGHTHDWPIEAVEGVLRDDGSNPGSEAAGEVVLVNDQRLARLFHRVEDRGPVERREATQVDHLHLDTFAGQRLRSLEAVVRHQPPREAAHVRALAPHRGRTEGDQVIAVRHRLGDQPVDLLVLEKQHGVRV